MPGFVLRLVLSDSEIKFDPPIEEFENTSMQMLDKMMQDFRNIPRVDVSMYPDWVRTELIFYANQSLLE